MSIDYTGSIELQECQVEHLLMKLARSAWYEIVNPLRDGRVSLRLRQRCRREQWPEDVEIRLIGPIAVSFFSADAAERQTLLAFVQNALREVGADIVFEEA